MPGMQIQGGQLVADKGTATGVTAQITSANSLVTIFTATKKTRVESIIVSNSLGTILPVDIYVYRDSVEDDFFLSKTRVLKSKHVLLRYQQGDGRNSEVAVDPTANRVNTEVILQIGDAIKASCPIEDVVNVTAYLKEGIK